MAIMKSIDDVTPAEWDAASRKAYNNMKNNNPALGTNNNLPFMTPERYQEVVNHFFEAINHIASTKGKEYTGGVDALKNFKDLSVIYGTNEYGQALITPTAICHVYMAKHYHSLCSIVKDRNKGQFKEYSEPIFSRCLDLIVYTMLLYANMLEAEHNNVDVPNDK